MAGDPGKALPGGQAIFEQPLGQAGYLGELFGGELGVRDLAWVGPDGFDLGRPGPGLAIALDEPTTRLPWSTAGPSHFAASEAAWDEFRESEYDALRRAWGSGIPTTLQHLMQGQCGVADEEIVQFLDRVAPRVQAAGFDVIAPGGLLRTSTVRRRFTSVNAPGGTTLSVAGLGLEADIQVDGLTLTEAELLELAASKSELVAVSGRWLRIGRADGARLAALARRLRRPVSPADLLADEAFEGVQMAADDVRAQGLRPARQTDPPAQVQATLRP